MSALTERMTAIPIDERNYDQLLPEEGTTTIWVDKDFDTYFGKMVQDDKGRLWVDVKCDGGEVDRFDLYYFKYWIKIS